MSKTTIVLGASSNAERYSYKAVMRLKQHGHDVIPLGKTAGEIDGIKIQTDKPDIKAVDTVTLYLNPRHQEEWYSYILSIHPRRIIFNPGAENPELVKLANSHGIQTDEACTLTLLAIGQY